MIRMLAMLMSAALVASSQETLTNDAIVKLAKAGISEAILLGMVNSQPGKYSAQVDDLIALTEAGVPDKVIAAMAAKGAVRSTPMSASASGNRDSLIPEEVGGYYLDGGRLKRLGAEVVRGGSTSPFRMMATGGFSSVKVKGKLSGARSPVQLSGEITLVLRCPEGMGPESYQLIVVDVKKDSREFTTGKHSFFGGMSNTPDDKAVAATTFEKVGPNTYRTIVNGLRQGEYVVYGQWGPVGSTGGPLGSMGKMFTFGVNK